MKARCPSCEHVMQIDESQLGTAVECEGCSRQLKLPAKKPTAINGPMTQPPRHGEQTHPPLPPPLERLPQSDAPQSQSLAIHQQAYPSQSPASVPIPQPQQQPNFPQYGQQQELLPAIPVGPSQGQLACPRCQCTYPPRVGTQISSTGWILFVLALLFCLPLFWIGLLVTEPISTCVGCGFRLG